MSIQNYNQISLINGKKLLIDANIWISLFHRAGTNPDRKYIDNTVFLKSILSKDITIILPCIVLSEVINRLYRFYLADYNNINNASLKLKDFRQYQEFKEATSEISLLIKTHMSKLQEKLDTIDDGFRSFDLNEDFFQFLQTLDFNDLIIAKICKEQNIDFLVTNDYDMSQFKDEINILTT
ncbi:MAG: PIN domain-containing protein [Elusimicrobiota bacterium]|jgi:predicted nucleic acid-binding protein|nr:PIN domain-containing protein [Elusimicrobiota bacterium]